MRAPRDASGRAMRKFHFMPHFSRPCVPHPTASRSLLMRAALFFFVSAVFFCGAFAGGSESLARALNDSFAAVYEKVSPSVVVVEVPRRASVSLVLGGYLDEGEPEQGSGVILSADGFLVTNSHVVAGAEKSEITVRFFDGSKRVATVVAKDEKTDLAVLQVDAMGLQAAELGDSDRVRVGEFAFAIGAPLDLPYTFTFGVISAKGRTGLTRAVAYENYLQTDAAINPGNSGGPLCDIDGRVIGINTLVGGTTHGLGFAIPINLVKEICSQLISAGRVRRPWIGINIEGIEENPRLKLRYGKIAKGVVVEAVLPGSPASKSALQEGDVILRIDGKEMRRAGDVQQAVLAKKIGETVRLDVWRDKLAWEISIATEELPADLQERAGSGADSPVPSVPPAVGGGSAVPSQKGGTAESLGVQVRELSSKLARELRVAEGVRGVVVTEVRPRSEADFAGLRVGDIISSVDDTGVETEEDFWGKLWEDGEETTWKLSFSRSGKRAILYLKKPGVF